ncbi:MAG: hypothetical protein Q8K45_18520 [Rubrivivax sp.]|nr:hypothetical protein [Rubrivivax sp.]
MNLLNLLSLLPWRRRPAPTAGARPDEAALPAPDAAEEERPRAPGWFDSSHDLQHGLSVREHATPDTLGRELPLASWLELQLAGFRATAPLTPQT